MKVGDRYMVPYEATIPGTEVTYTMEPIPGGQFKLGSPADEVDRSADEGPQRTITVEPFWMGKYEVTWAEYRPYMALYHPFKQFEERQIRVVTKQNEADVVSTPSQPYDLSFHYESGDDPRLPAVTMSPLGARQYTRWLSGLTQRQYRLPSEAEWEYACRAGTTTAYHFGNDNKQLGDYAWFYDNANAQAQPVGRKKPNPWQLHDMHGNVWEWTLDHYSDKGYQHLADRAHSAAEAVRWPREVYSRTVRGGSWDEMAPRCRSAVRLASDERWQEVDPALPPSPWWYTDDPVTAVGFRILRPFKQATPEQMAKYWHPQVDSVREAVEIKLLDGAGARGLVDEHLPAAIKKLEKRSE